MFSRQRVLTALSRKVPDRVPKTMSFSPSQMQQFRAKTGRNDPEDYFGFDVRTVQPGPVTNDADFSSYLGELPLGARVDEWGIAWIGGSEFHFERMVHPLRNAQTPRDILSYPYPNLVAEERFIDFDRKIEAIHEKGLAVVADCMAVGGTVFWPAYKLRGMETLLMDLVADPVIAGTLLDIVTELLSGLGQRLASYDIDILWLADDFGTQRSLMMRPDLWRAWFKGRLRSVIAAIKRVNSDLLVAFHSDGKIDEIIPDLIDIDVDVLNPLQPEVMDPVWIKRTYGKYLAFWGGVGTQTTMPFGTPGEVRQTIRHLIQTVGEGGGLLVAPTHIVEPEVPWENILAFIEAVETFGGYT